MCVLYVRYGCVVMGSPLLFIVQIARIFCRVRREQSASCFVWIWYKIVLFCPGKNLMYVWLYVFLDCTRACVCGCNGDVVYVGHDLNRCTGWW